MTEFIWSIDPALDRICCAMSAAAAMVGSLFAANTPPAPSIPLMSAASVTESN
jgi:hypothetical protein